MPDDDKQTQQSMLEAQMNALQIAKNALLKATLSEVERKQRASELIGEMQAWLQGAPKQFPAISLETYNIMVESYIDELEQDILNISYQPIKKERKQKEHKPSSDFDLATESKPKQQLEAISDFPVYVQDKTYHTHLNVLEKYFTPKASLKADETEEKIRIEDEPHTINLFPLHEVKSVRVKHTKPVTKTSQFANDFEAYVPAVTEAQSVLRVAEESKFRDHILSSGYRAQTDVITGRGRIYAASKKDDKGNVQKENPSEALSKLKFSVIEYVMQRLAEGNTHFNLGAPRADKPILTVIAIQFLQSQGVSLKNITVADEPVDLKAYSVELTREAKTYCRDITRFMQTDVDYKPKFDAYQAARKRARKQALLIRDAMVDREGRVKIGPPDRAPLMNVQASKQKSGLGKVNIMPPPRHTGLMSVKAKKQKSDDLGTPFVKMKPRH